MKSFSYLVFACALLVSITAQGQEPPQQQQQEEAEAPVKLEFEDLVKLLESGTNDEKILAAALLVDHSERLDEFIEPLLALFAVRDDAVVDTVKRVVFWLGPDVVAIMDEELDATNLDQLRQQCSAINAIGDPAATFEPQLLEILDTSTDPRTRTAATFALTGFSRGCPEAIEKILVDLEHPDMNTKLFACRLIIKTGPEATQAVPALVELLDNGNISERSYAAWSLGAIGPTNQFDTIQALIEMLDRFNVIERERALIGLGLLGEESAAAEAKTRLLMAEDGTNLEGQAAVTLWQITGDAEEPVARLVELSKGIDFEVKGLQLLGDMGPAAADAMDFLIERANSEDEAIQVYALDTIAKIGPAANEHHEAIQALTEDEDPVVRLAARMTLRKITDE
ncbi:MAG: HEAT repeat domain-containing protein [Pirellulaceae bacterium]